MEVVGKTDKMGGIMMDAAIAFMIGLLIGALFGVFLTALMVASREDE